jgi:hypothetical protein
MQSLTKSIDHRSLRRCGAWIEILAPRTSRLRLFRRTINPSNRYSRYTSL